MKWYELEITVDSEAVEPVSALFARYGYHEGVYVQEHVESKDEEGGFTVDASKPVIVRTYLPAGIAGKEAIEVVERELYYLNMIRPLGTLTVRERDDDEWQDAWKEFFPVLHIGKRIVIKPSWVDYSPTEGEAVVELDPGMAFGTGLHPSTRVVLEFLETYVKDGDYIADIGTGSGILAIAAARLGARKVWAVDNDQVAAKVAAENVKTAGLTDRITVYEGSSDAVLNDESRIAEAPQVDVVLANIIARVIIELGPDFEKLLKPGGYLLAAGIIAERRDEVVEAVNAAGFSIVEEKTEGDWVGLAAQKKDRG